jgi:hypothetical protein
MRNYGESTTNAVIFIKKRDNMDYGEYIYQIMRGAWNYGFY